MSSVMNIIFCFLCVVGVTRATICNPHTQVNAKPDLSLLWPKLLGNLGGLGGLLPNRSSVDVSNVCVYSSNPDKFKPRCFLCPNSAYPNILKACSERSTNSTEDIDFDQASCIEKNCGINYPEGTHEAIRVGRVLSPDNEEKEKFTEKATTPCDSMHISEDNPRSIYADGKNYLVTRCEIAYIVDRPKEN